MELAARYVALWNEPDAARRRAAVAQVFAEDAAHRLDPPQEARELAAALVVTPIFEARGHADLEARVTRAYEEWVEAGGFSFRPKAGAVRNGDAVKLTWEMVAQDGTVAAVGHDFLLLAPDGRVRLDYQFIEP